MGGADEYADWLEGRGYAARTIEQRLILYAGRVAAWGSLDVPEHVIAGWLGSFRGWSRRTYHNHLISVYDWMVDTGQRVDNPARTIRRAPAPDPRPRPLSEPELRQALAIAEPRTRAFLMLAYLAGLRASEIAAFHGRDISASSLYVYGKGGQGWMLPTHPLLWDLAQSYPREGFWFGSPQSGREHVCSSTVTRSISDLFGSLGIEGATHRARHTYGTELLRGGANLRVVQELMRHRSLATTALYLGVSESEREAAIRSLAA